jgi:hypothetical protein
MRRVLAIFVLGSVPFALAQEALDKQPAAPIELPFVIDSNSPMFWRDGLLRVYSSSSEPLVHTLNAKLRHLYTQKVILDRTNHLPMWIEAVWEDSNGTLYAWYHHERTGVCPGSRLNVPEIGALVSYDGGLSFRDLGIVLRSGNAPDCWAQNGYFAGGHGDFSVIADQNNEYFYFLFGSYGGELANQGVGIARMPISARDNPSGSVWKYFDGDWLEPGIGGQVTPIFPATVAWQFSDTDSFWGPSIHWNTYLQRFVVLMNRSCCWQNWPQEGVYLTMNADLSDPSAWTSPVKIIDGGDWYPWVKGLGRGETSSLAGQRSRLFVRQTSEWRIVFSLEPGSSPPGKRRVRIQIEPDNTNPPR